MIDCLPLPSDIMMRLPTSTDTNSASSAITPSAASLLFARSNKRWKGVTLPPDFQPSALDVLCGRGKDCYNHEGNQRFRQIIEDTLPKYVECTSKHEKGLLVVRIVETVRNRGGGFVRYDNASSQWLEIGDDAAREKVGQTIREALIQQDPEKRSRKRQRRAFNKKRRKELRQQQQQQDQQKDPNEQQAELVKSDSLPVSPAVAPATAPTEPVTNPLQTLASTAAAAAAPAATAASLLPMGLLPIHPSLVLSPLMPMAYSSQELLMLAAAQRRREQLLMQNPAVLASLYAAATKNREEQQSTETNGPAAPRREQSLQDPPAVLAGLYSGTPNKTGTETLTAEKENDSVSASG